MTTPDIETIGAQGNDIWYERDGARLFARDVGSGRPILFFHGGLADHRAALFRVGALAATHRLVAPDLRGSGRSVYAGELSWDRLADDAAALLARLGIERAVVGGVSMGSAVAIRFALRHPSKLRGLVLMSPVYPGEDLPLAEPARVAMHAMGEVGRRVLEQGIDALRPLFEPLPEPIRSVAMQMALGFDAKSVAATTRFLASNEQPMSSARDLAAIDVPVLLLPGIDPEHPAEVAELYARHFERASIVEQTAPDAMEKIARFCADLD